MNLFVFISSCSYDSRAGELRCQPVNLVTSSIFDLLYISGYQQYFDRFATEGLLDKEGFKRVLQCLGADPPQCVVDKIFAEHDKDENSQLNQEEFHEWIQDRIKSKPQMRDSLMESLDILFPGQDAVNIDELLEKLSELGEQFDDTERTYASMMLTQFDSNKDGAIANTELSTCFYSDDKQIEDANQEVEETNEEEGHQETAEEETQEVTEENQEVEEEKQEETEEKEEVTEETQKVTEETQEVTEEVQEVNEEPEEKAEENQEVVEEKQEETEEKQEMAEESQEVTEESQEVTEENQEAKEETEEKAEENEEVKEETTEEAKEITEETEGNQTAVQESQQESQGNQEATEDTQETN
ncbi:probable inactive protein kinase DDB_G0270444 [Saccostrea cucullata]|uniref:probable inactive protein kinase DDB_G0270444 n=1 Tax=Saccostrea cuccullata TaxID=36930 RepID=UPI002ECFDE6D